MVSRDEALALVRQWLGVGEDTPLGLYEFDGGYVGYPLDAPTGDPTQPPPTSGAARVVVDKVTGKLTQGASLPPALVAQQYEAQQAAADRFPPDVLAALTQAGWRPGRDVSPMVDAWLAANATALAGLNLSAAARAVLNEFGGLTLQQAGPGGKPKGGFDSRLFPQQGQLVTESVRAFRDLTGLDAFPVGDHTDGPSDLLVTPDGRVFLLHWADDFFVGGDFDEALVWLVRGGEILPVADDGSY